VKFSVYQRSEQASRKNNEDRVGYVYTQEAALFVVADGMGGHANGELAAQIALESVTELFGKQAIPLLADPREFLSNAFMQAHHQILHFSHEQGMDDTPRTTLTVLVIQDGRAMWAHCGDTRLYWLRDSQLMIRTLDHSYAEQMPHDAEKNGNADFMSKIANRNVLFTCLGSPAKPIFDIHKAVQLKPGDKFLIASDGLWGCITEEVLADSLSATPVTQSVPDLIDMALKNGGIYGDNVTGIGVEWKGN
jgi:serine/threonine protein phosphatase PrpC